MRERFAARRIAVGALVLACAASLSVQAQTPVRTDSSATGTIVGVVVARETDARLQYSVVSVASLGRERFTNERGEFTLGSLPAGTIRLRVRHLGYTPIEIAVTVRRDRVDTVRVRMTKLAVSLSGVMVHAVGRCTNPGPPSAAADPNFAAIFDQLRENADRYRLLADQYPFVYTVERLSSVHYVGGESIVQRLDTLSIGTGTRWRYAQGTIVEQNGDPRNRQVVFNIPTLPQFAERSFLETHCFANGGADTANGHAAIRIDFSASAKIKSPDVTGSMYLDRETYQIRRSVLRLTRVPDETPQIATVEVISDFEEVLPSIALAAHIESAHSLHTDRTRPVLPDTAYETQRMLRVVFLKAKPGEP